MPDNVKYVLEGRKKRKQVFAAVNGNEDVEMGPIDIDLTGAADSDDNE